MSTNIYEKEKKKYVIDVSSDASHWSSVIKETASLDGYFCLALSYSSKNIRRVISSEGFSALDKKHRRGMSSEGCAAHPVGYNSPLQIKMAFGALFKIQSVF